jgi:hypothetical protein
MSFQPVGALLQPTGAKNIQIFVHADRGLSKTSPMFGGHPDDLIFLAVHQ